MTNPILDRSAAQLFTYASSADGTHLDLGYALGGSDFGRAVDSWNGTKDSATDFMRDSCTCSHLGCCGNFCTSRFSTGCDPCILWCVATSNTNETKHLINASCLPPLVCHSV
jgi:hypothetical protein